MKVRNVSSAAPDARRTPAKLPQLGDMMRQSCFGRWLYVCDPVNTCKCRFTRKLWSADDLLVYAWIERVQKLVRVTPKNVVAMAVSNSRVYMSYTTSSQAPGHVIIHSSIHTMVITGELGLDY